MSASPSQDTNSDTDREASVRSEFAPQPESAKENENLDVFLVDNESGQNESQRRTYRIRQITGQFARRIVCWVRPGDVLERGDMFGMIKLGSELVVPDSESLQLVAKVGDKVCAGSTTLACYRHPLGAAVSETAGHPQNEDSQ